MGLNKIWVFWWVFGRGLLELVILVFLCLLKKNVFVFKICVYICFNGFYCKINLFYVKL